MCAVVVSVALVMVFNFAEKQRDNPSCHSRNGEVTDYADDHKDCVSCIAAVEVNIGIIRKFRYAIWLMTLSLTVRLMNWE